MVEDVEGKFQMGWKAAAMGGLVVASWLSGIVMQATHGILPSGSSCGCGAGECRTLQRRIDEDRERLSAIEGDMARLRREFDRHLTGRGLGSPAGSPNP